ncbi:MULTISPECIES: hypothetical protein [Microbulbifer]|uniref:hypothetical protein n=1 Tax=Microbulbifer TaxID=48073 RepID=UPI001E47E92C|nr:MULTISPECIES: hypothetical protein [Microbulbifer]UHQ54595.1 hypothetical protein LVE68_13955 [Microbulbifer sp. YPW16]
MKRAVHLPLLVAGLSTAAGGIAFVYNWQCYDGGWPYFGIVLLPGNLVLSLFTEEIDFWPKLALQMSGQFLVTFTVAVCGVRMIGWLKGCLGGSRP